MKRKFMGLAFAATASLIAASAAAAGTLDDVKTKGFVQCGVNPGLIGFGTPDAQNNWTGMDIDFCRAVAAAIFNDPTKVKLDPDNKLLWRANRQRLDSEALRDAILAAAGTLNEQLGGPSIRVPLEPEVVENIFTEYEPDNLWPVHPDPKQHTRRSLYLLRKRNVKLPMLVAFDTPDLMSVCGARNVSVHSLQALTLMNSDFTQAQAEQFAARIRKQAAENPEAQIEAGWRLAFVRAQEMPICYQNRASTFPAER